MCIKFSLSIAGGLEATLKAPVARLVVLAQAAHRRQFWQEPMKSVTTSALLEEQEAADFGVSTVE